FALALTANFRFAIVPPRVRTVPEHEEAKRMTLRSYRLSIYAFLFALGISTAFAQEKHSCCTKSGKCATSDTCAAPMPDESNASHAALKQMADDFCVVPIFEGGAIGKPIPLAHWTKNLGASKCYLARRSCKCCQNATAGKECCEAAACSHCTKCCEEECSKCS